MPSSSKTVPGIARSSRSIRRIECIRPIRCTKKSLSSKDVSVSDYYDSSYLRQGISFVKNKSKINIARAKKPRYE